MVYMYLGHHMLINASHYLADANCTQKNVYDAD